MFPAPTLKYELVNQSPPTICSVNFRYCRACALEEMPPENLTPTLLDVAS